jgi:hypothetical protein
VSRSAPTSALLAALAVALCAPGAAAQVPEVDIPADPAAVEIPHESAISEQYQAVEEAVEQAVPAVPEPPAPEPQPTPEPAPPAPQPEQYHSEAPKTVSVTQDQPSNVNVSIRINSPGDDGPVVQINNAGGSAVVEQVVEAVQGKPQGSPGGRAESPGALPDNWEWTWTSACFGGAARAAAAVPGWTWRWSCDAEKEEGKGPPGLEDLVPAAPDAFVDDILASVPGPAIGFTSPEASRAAPAARSERRRAPAVVVAPAVGSSGGGGPPLARPLLTATAAVPAAVAEQVRHVVRAATARARPPGSDTLLTTPGGGPAVGAGNALGAVASLLLGIWIAVLITAIVLVVPRLRRRRRSGPAWRLKRQLSPRLERPG